MMRDSEAESNAGVAQLAEQLICNQQVAGSSPIASSIDGSGKSRAGVAEWLKAADCKSAGVMPTVVRTHPPAPFCWSLGGSNSVVESRPSKPLVAGSSPVSRSNRTSHRPRSSVVEHVLGKDGVTSSNLVVGSIQPKTSGRVRHLASPEGPGERGRHIWPRRSLSGQSRT